jgi:4-hydroxybenzoate polyprenyltransferase
MLLGLAVISMAVGMALWLIRNILTFLFLGLGVLLMIAVYAIEYKRT